MAVIAVVYVGCVVATTASNPLSESMRALVLLGIGLAIAVPISAWLYPKRTIHPVAIVLYVGTILGAVFLYCLYIATAIASC